MKSHRLTRLAAVLLATIALAASAQEQKDVSQTEKSYQAGTSPLMEAPMV